MQANVTREHKLALIIGFSLVLVVGVLISDHFSKARSSQVATEITPGTAERFGADTQGMRVVSAGGGPAFSAPQPVITTPPSELPPVTPAAPPSLVMGEPNPGIIDRVVNGLGENTNVLTHTQTQPLPSGFEPHASGVRPIDPTTGTLGASPVVDLAGAPQIVEPTTAPAMEPVREPTTAGVPDRLLKRHDVREGESLYRIAQNAYGDGNLWTKLVPFNKGKISSNGSVRVGVTLVLPPKEALLGKPLPEAADARTTEATRRSEPASKKADAKSAPRTYTVQRGDTLSDISRKTLGTSKRWQEIMELNRLEDETALVVGATIKIPAR